MTTSMSNVRFPGTVRQLGHVVADLDASVAAWTTKLGVGPWTIMRNIPLQSVYLGKPTVPVIDIALSYRGDVQIELIQQKNDAASPYRTYIDRGQFGLHHIAFVCERIDDDVAQAQRQRLELVFEINMPGGGRYVYFKSPVPGEQTFVEFLEATGTIKQMFEHGVPAAAAWDGTGAPTVIDFAAMTART
jgi:methylmalonyl-CoA/ethylmalonyl-CoA epimerase